MKKRVYERPRLIHYGRVTLLTQGGAGSGLDGGPAYMNMGMVMGMSDIRCKHNLVRIGSHPYGFGLYLFDYRPEFEKHPQSAGAYRHFGVLAQEVEAILPAAVHTDSQGFRMVDYAMLGLVDCR